jgi:hypothetical protein
MAATRSRNPPLSKQFRDRGSGPQGLRRPRFSFFLFTCQTARNHGGPVPGSPESIRSPKPPTKIGSLVTVVVRSFGGALSRPSGRRRAVPAYIVPPGPSCQHLLRLAKPAIFALPLQRRHRRSESGGQAVRTCSRAPLRPHSSAVLAHQAGGVQLGVFAPASRSEATGVTRPAA